MPTVATAQEEQNVIVHYWPAAHNYKNTAVFHSNSVKYYHFKQAAAAPCPRQARRREPGEERAVKGLPTAEGEWATELVNPWDAFSSHPRLHQGTEDHCSAAKCSHVGSSC